jgi:hypothetical protein
MEEQANNKTPVKYGSPNGRGIKSSGRTNSIE